MINKYAGIEYEDVVRQYADDITRLCVVWTQNGPMSRFSTS